MSIKADYTHSSFKMVLADRPFGVNVTEDELKKLEESLDGYSLFYSFLFRLGETQFEVSNGMHADLLKLFLKLKLEADIYIHSCESLKLPSTVFSDLLEKIHTMLMYGDKFANPLIFCRPECSDSLLDESFGILYELHSLCEEALPYLEYDKDAYMLVYTISKAAMYHLEKIVEYRADLDTEQEELTPSIGNEANELFINSLGLDPFQDLPIEMRLTLLEGWDPVLLRHKAVLSGFFELEDSDISAELTKEANEMLEGIRALDPNRPDKMVAFIRDVLMSFNIKLKAVREHCTNTPIPLFLARYDGVYDSFLARLQRHMN